VRVRGATWAEAASLRDRTRVEPESGSRSGTVSMGGAHLAVRGERGANWAAGLGEGEAKRLVGLGRAVEKKGAAGPGLVGGRGEKGKKKEREWANWAVGRRKRKGRKRRKWAGPKEKEEKKKIQMHLNLNLKFKFKWKTSNRTVQCGMK
jgi:hypothetical protein